MDPNPIITRLERFPAALHAAVAIASPSDVRFKPPSGNWSVLEVVCHLADEEVDDFRMRVRFILDRTPGTWPPIEPSAWARDRKYNEQDPGAALARFTSERARSIAWLRTLPRDTDWALAYPHPDFGPIRAGDLLASWAAHDALHLRQIAKRFWELAGRDAPGFSTAYAGEWAA
jgi:hypothetical protein